MKWQKFKKKPIVIEAIQWNGEGETAIIIQEIAERKVEYGNGILIIHTLEGEMRADLNDWIIKGIKGEIYPCKPDIFEMTYEKSK